MNEQKSIETRVDQRNVSPQSRALVTGKAAVESALAHKMKALSSLLSQSGAMTVEYFLRMIVSAVEKDPKLLACTNTPDGVVSIVNAALEAAQYGLRPNTVAQEAFLIPRSNKVTLQLGKNGFVKMAMRTGLVRAIGGGVVYEGEKFEWDPAGNTVKHVADMEASCAPNGTNVVAAYAWVEFSSGVKQWEVLRRGDLDRARKAGGGGPSWANYYDRMAERSAISRLCRSKIPLDEAMIDLFGRGASASDEHVALASATVVSPDGEVVYDNDTGEVFSGGEEVDESPPDTPSSPPPADEEPPPPGEAPKAVVLTGKDVLEVGKSLSLTQKQVMEHLGLKTLKGMDHAAAEAACKTLQALK